MNSIFPFDKYHFKSNSILEELPKEDLTILQTHLTTHTYKKGQMVFREGGNPTGIYFLKEGKVKKFTLGDEGVEHIFYVCSSGELLGYHAVLSGEQYPDSAATMEDSVISFIPRDDFLKALEKSRELSNRLLKSLSHEFAVFISHSTILAQKTVRERLALGLLILKGKYKTDNGGKSPVELTLSHTDLANYVGTSIETLSRLLKDFKDEKLIETQGRKIIMLNPQGLIKVANYY